MESKDPAFPSLRRISSNIDEWGEKLGCLEAHSNIRSAEDSSFWRRRVSKSCEGEKSGGSCCDGEGLKVEGELELEAKGTKNLKVDLKEKEVGFEWCTV